MFPKQPFSEKNARAIAVILDSTNAFLWGLGPGFSWYITNPNSDRSKIYSRIGLIPCL